MQACTPNWPFWGLTYSASHSLMTSPITHTPVGNTYLLWTQELLADEQPYWGLKKRSRLTMICNNTCPASAHGTPHNLIKVWEEQRRKATGSGSTMQVAY